MPTTNQIFAALAVSALFSLPAAAPVMAQTDGSAPKAEKAEGEAPAAEAPPADPALVIATVNGEDVTLGDLIALRAELPPQYQSIPDGVLYDGLVEQLSNQILLRQAAEKAGVPDRPAVKRGLQFQRTSYLAELYVRERLNEQITEDAVAAEYEATYQDAEKAQQFKARHILLEDEAKAEDIAAQAKAEGADFAALAKENSTGPSAPNGGDLGWFEKGQMVPEFEAAVTALEPGQISDPVKTQFGWHVIMLEDAREAPTPPLAEVRQEIIGEMTRKITESVIAAIRDNGEVSVVEGQPGIGSLRDDALIADE